LQVRIFITSKNFYTTLNKFRAMSTALAASGAKASAPIWVANAPVTGAPPIITLTESLSPEIDKASIVALILLIVVVSMALIAKTLG
jgi:hypothetical protein